MAERRTRTEETLGQSGAIALFDVDDTLIAGYTVFPFVRMLSKQGLVSEHVSAALEAARLTHHNKVITYQQFADDVVTHYCQCLEGKSQTDIEAFGKIFLAHIEAKMLHGFSGDLVKMLNERALTIAISGSPVEVLRPLTNHLGIKEAIGLEAEVSDGHYTGRVKTNTAVRSEKEKVIAAIVGRGYSKKTSFAFGDSDSDVRILEVVDNPFAVNPKPDLRDLATANGWHIVNSGNILSEVRITLENISREQKNWGNPRQA